jgi:hypothetical protein
MMEPTDEMVRAFSDADFSGLGNAVPPTVTKL